jgi:transposase
MSLPSRTLPPIPDETLRVARAAFPKGSFALHLCDLFPTLSTDACVRDLYPPQGQPAFAPWRLILVTILQFTEDLTDRQAAEAVRARIDWKCALSLPLTDPGFDYSILSEFRTRLVIHAASERLLDTLLTELRAQGLVRPRGRQRTDSTHVLAAIRILNRLECVGEAVRHALNSLAVVAPEWLQQHLQPIWAERYGHRVEQFRLPSTLAARTVLTNAIGADGQMLLQAIDTPSAPPWLREVPAVVTLRRIWEQQYEPSSDGTLQWRAERALPAAPELINSPYDPDAHYSVKRTTIWTGYKVHLSETCEPDLPLVVTNVRTTPAPEPDVQALAAIQAAMVASKVAPGTHLVDQGYIDAETLVASEQEAGIRVVGPVSHDSSWQAKEGGFTLDDFQIDWAAKQVTCPQGVVSQGWRETQALETAVIRVQFGAAVCRQCPVRERCTRSVEKGRSLTLRTEAAHRALQAAREHQTTAAFKAEYAARAGVEGLLGQGVKAYGLRRSRYLVHNQATFSGIDR